MGLGFSNSDLSGHFAVSFDGHVKVDGLWIPIASAGVLRADGHGNLWLNRVLHTSFGIIGGMLQPLASTACVSQKGTGTYSFAASGIGTATIWVQGGQSPALEEKFAFVIDDIQRELQFVSMTPNVIVRGIGQRTKEPAYSFPGIIAPPPGGPDVLPDPRPEPAPGA